MEQRPTIGHVVALEPDGLTELVAALRRGGRRVVGPVVRDGAVVLGEITEAADLPWGVRDAQEAGRYELTEGPRLGFGVTHGPQPWKRVLFPPRERLWRARREDGHVVMEPEIADRPVPLALLGVRPCDLAALAVLDRVLADGPHPDASYAERRSTALVVAVQCTRPSGTCFCSSAGTGPQAGPGADVVLTELDVEGHEGLLLAEAISDAGADLLADVAHRAASDAEMAAAESALTEAESHMGRELPRDGLADALRSSLTSSRWDRIGERCLACGSCTLVCPTCFCSTVEDVTDLTGESTERWSRWDSCFTGDFSYLHGGSVRVTTGARYRQWLTHKLSTWERQFGTAGCVGCGRCITWCPVGIDITEEAAALAGEVS